jgi:glycosyltransferase involved in cell wall biosynthesis
VRATVIVPFHRNVMHLHACLSAVSRAAPPLELIVAADGAIEDCGFASREFAARIVVVPGPAGPAVARNRAASQAGGAILVFVDADVVPAASAIEGMCAFLEINPSVAGVFGAYDRAPAARNFVSEFKNLSHAYVHEAGNRTASTFWAGLGAVRAEAFWSVGGFDERFARPSVEDIDLGYRLVAAGRLLRLDPGFRGTHLKRWTLWNCVRTDVVARGIPWVQLILRFRTLRNDLNTSMALRWSLGLAYGTAIGLMLAVVDTRAVIAATAMFGALVAVNRDYYRWLARQRGWLFAVRVAPLHLLHHLCNGVSLLVGTALHLAQRAGVELPGVLPASSWPARARPAVDPLRT